MCEVAGFRTVLLEIQISQTYSIAIAERSRSTLLRDISAKQHLGKPIEFFHCPYETNRKRSIIDRIVPSKVR
jgi:hypothetical protein